MICINKVGRVILLATIIGVCSSFFQTDFKEVKNIASVLDPIKAVSLQTHTISANFTEEKQLAAFNKPQFAKGKFYYVEKDKMRWEQNTPFDYLILINGKQLTLRENFY